MAAQSNLPKNTKARLEILKREELDSFLWDSSKHIWHVGGFALALRYLTPAMNPFILQLGAKQHYHSTVFQHRSDRGRLRWALPTGWTFTAPVRWRDEIRLRKSSWRLMMPSHCIAIDTFARQGFSFYHHCNNLLLQLKAYDVKRRVSSASHTHILIVHNHPLC